MSLPEEFYGFIPIDEVDGSALSGFSCGKPRLDSFLTDTALGYHKARLGFSKVVFHRDVSEPLGFFTLANASVQLNASEIFELGFDVDVRLSSFPAINIGRFAVHKDWHGQGVGSQMMRLIIGEVLDSETLSASRLVVVDSDNDDSAIGFYKKLGFEKSLWAEQVARTQGKKHRKTVKMHMDIFKSLGAGVAPPP